MKHKTLSAFLILGVFLTAILFLSNSRTAGAVVVTKYLSGYAWSSNIGWISFSSGVNPQYAVKIDNYDSSSASYFSGYAWSSNIGWISFGCGAPDPDLTKVGLKLCSEEIAGTAIVYPTGGSLSSGPVLGSDNKIRGWARACSVFSSGCSGSLKDNFYRGGWDGWISLSGLTLDGGSSYGVVFDPATRKFSSFAWGGGSDSDVSGNNISPQFPGWISFSGTNYGVTMVDAIVGAQTASCVHTPAVINVGGTVNWTASIVPPAGGTHTYVWTVGGGTLVSGQGSPTLTVSYPASGVAIVAPSVMIDGDSMLTSNCGGTIVIGPKEFQASAVGEMSARFIRSINTTTVPVTVSVSVGRPAGQTVPYGYRVTLRFDRIERNADGVVKASGVGSGADQGKAMLVSSVDLRSDLDPDKSGGDSSTVVLHLTKNQNTTDSSSPVLPTGSYTVFMKVTPVSGAGSIKTVPIPLRIDNPSGGVREI